MRSMCYLDVQNSAYSPICIGLYHVPHVPDANSRHFLHWVVDWQIWCEMYVLVCNVCIHLVFMVGMKCNNI